MIFQHDDTTIFHITNDPNDKSLQSAVDTAITWSQSNSMKINASKTKEILVNYMKTPLDVPHIIVQDQSVDRVKDFKLLGVYFNDKLNWETHVNHIYKKACQRIHFISCLKRIKLSPQDLVKVYTSLVRPITEYACQLWHPGLTGEQIDILETIQERVLKIIYPCLEYNDALNESKLDKLYDRREKLSERLFVDAQQTHHKLFPLMPPLREFRSNVRDSYPFSIPLCHTSRYKNTFINHGLSRKW